MARYIFNVELSGEGDDVAEAWRDAAEAFAADPGEPSENATLIGCDEDDDEEEA